MAPPVAPEITNYLLIMSYKSVFSKRTISFSPGIIFLLFFFFYKKASCFHFAPRNFQEQPVYTIKQLRFTFALLSNNKDNKFVLDLQSNSKQLKSSTSKPVSKMAKKLFSKILRQKQLPRKVFVQGSVSLGEKLLRKPFTCFWQ